MTRPEGDNGAGDTASEAAGGSAGEAPGRPDAADLLALARDAAAAAGDLLRDGRPDDLRTRTKSTPTDVVTVMDAAAEDLLVSRLLGARPDDGLLGEEGGERAGTSGLRWVVDPLDGTVNYLYGLGRYAVSVAAEVDGRSVVGVVVDPELRTTWWAVRGAGAWRDGVPLRCSSAATLDQALVATGFGYDVARRRAQGRVVAGVLPAVRDIRRLGSAALDLCSVAEGRVDAYYERGCSAWDYAAGALVAEEAGALVTGLRGRPAGTDLILAASPGLHPALHDLLADLRADED